MDIIVFKYILLLGTKNLAHIQKMVKLAQMRYRILWLSSSQMLNWKVSIEQELIPFLKMTNNLTLGYLRISLRFILSKS